MTRLRLEENSSKQVTQVDESNALSHLPEYRGAEVPPTNLPETIELTCYLLLPRVDEMIKIKLVLNGIVYHTNHD